MCLVDMLFVKTFLLSYQSFTTPDKLLHKLIERYNVVRPEDMGLQQFDAIRTTIQVFSVDHMMSCELHIYAGESHQCNQTMARDGS